MSYLIETHKLRRQMQANLWKLEANLLCIVSSRTSRATGEQERVRSQNKPPNK